MTTARMTRRRRTATPSLEKLDGPTPEQLANNHYTRDFTNHVDTNTLAMTHISQHDPVMRWIAAGRLTDGQQAAIALCQHLWDTCGLQQRLTASWGERMPPSYGIERRALTVIEAREDLHRIQDYIPPAYWSVWENCCRHGMQAGIAGGEDDRNGAHRALIIVCYTADIIATRERL